MAGSVSIEVMAVQTIPLEKIQQTHHLLRPVRKNEVDYLELRDSMASSGQLNSILVRPVEDEFEVVDGMYRWTVAHELNWKTLDCSIDDVEDKHLILKQLQCNGIRPETRPVEFARALKSILAANEGMDMVGLSSYIKKSPSWIKNMLGLLEIRVKYQDAVNRGIMPLMNAYKLAKVPGAMQDELYESACIMPTREFAIIANGAIMQFKAAMKTGRLEGIRAKFVELKPYLKSVKELRQELENPENIGILLAKYPCKVPIECVKLGIQFAMNSDPHTLEIRREKYEAVEQKRLNQVKHFKQPNEENHD